ncbi:hypothetical protein ACFWOJ_10070 [Streptomyces sp. NPDC058439]|uniref:hypothetical protein n=1 Tax=Streptomyces sp. NPDC058439 TaxID=3346500 RepID=UPI00364AF55C
MTKIETADVFATGRRGGGGSLYAYRVRGRGRSAVVPWIGGRGDEPDQVFAVPGAGRMAAAFLVNTVAPYLKADAAEDVSRLVPQVPCGSGDGRPDSGGGRQEGVIPILF